MEDDYEIIVKDGMQLLTYKGEVLPGQVSSVIKQDMDDLERGKYSCTATITVFAILKNNT